MCFRVHYIHKFMKTAEEDIPCWKMYTDYENDVNGFSSLYRSFRYKFDTRYYLSDQKKRFYAEHNVGGSTSVNEGFHSYTSEKRAKATLSSYNERIVECYIPKGSNYYYNPDDMEYVSNRIHIGPKSKYKPGLPRIMYNGLRRLFSNRFY